jgi:subtilisin family serine protease
MRDNNAPTTISQSFHQFRINSILRPRWLAPFAVLTLLAVSPSAAELPNIDSPARALFSKDTILIKPRKDGETPALKGSAAGLFTPIVQDRQPITQALADLHHKLNTRVVKTLTSLGNIQVIALPPGADVKDTIWQFIRSGLVQVAEPDYFQRTFVSPNDPLLSHDAARRLPWDRNYLDPHVYTSDTFQYHLYNDANRTINIWQDGNSWDNFPSTAGADMEAVQGWDVRQSAPNVIVAIIDDGVRYTHEDLAPNMWTNSGEIPSNGIDDDGNGYIDDVYGICPQQSGNLMPTTHHGTHIAGILGAKGNNGLGTCGIAWDVKLMAPRAISINDAFSTSALIELINYAVNNGASILNLSWGNHNISSSLRDAMQRARDAGVICVAAASNFDENADIVPTYPAAYDLDNIVAVNGSRPDDTFYTGFSYGMTSCDLAAPADSILSTYFGSDSGYAWGSGNSYAAPQVSGVLALLKAQFPGDSYLQLINRLLSSVDKLPSLTGRCQTGGRVNLHRALTTTTSRPANDDFADSFPFAPNPNPATVAIGNNVGANREPSEPSHAGNSGGSSVWWSWTPDSSFLGGSSGKAIVSTEGSSFDTLLAVYTGSSVGALSLVASNDNAPNVQTSAVGFQAQEGVTYRIAVDGHDDATGTIRLAIRTMPFSDFNFDGKPDLLLQDSSSYSGVWFMDSYQLISGALFYPYALDPSWRLVSSGDFNDDGKPDLVWQQSTGALATWLMNGVNLDLVEYFQPISYVDPAWTLIGTGDFNQDKQTDLLFQHADGSMAVWYLSGLVLQSAVYLNPATYGADPANWKAVAVGDFNGDGKSDIVLQHTITGNMVIRTLDGITGTGDYPTNPPNLYGDPNWRVVAAVDLNQNHATDLVFQHSQTGDLKMWSMGNYIVGQRIWEENLQPSNPGGTWKVVGP